MQSLFKDQWSVRVVRDIEPHRESASNDELVGKMKVVITEAAAELGRPQCKGQMEIVPGQRGEGQRPVLDARKPVAGACLAIVTGGEPGKSNWNATTNGLARREVALSAEEQDRLLPDGLPVGEVRSLQIDRRLRARRADIRIDEAGRCCSKGKNASDGEVFVELYDVHHCRFDCLLVTAAF